MHFLIINLLEKQGLILLIYRIKHSSLAVFNQAR